MNAFFHRPQSVAFRKALFQVHLWTGIGVGLYIVVISLTGALLVFRAEMQRALFPRLFAAQTAGGSRASVETVVRKIKDAYPDYDVSGVDAPSPTRQTFLAYPTRGAEFRTVFADPHSGEVVGELPRDSALSTLQNLHYELVGGATGRTLNGIGALCLVAMCVSGAVIWWPGAGRWRRGFVVDLSSGWKRVTWDLHSAIGVWTVALVFAWALSGAYFVFPGQFRALVNWWPPAERLPSTLSDASRRGLGAVPSLDSLVEKARQASPDSDLVRVILPSSDLSPITIVRTRAGRPRAEDDLGVAYYFDRYSGNPLGVRDQAPATTGDRFIEALVTLHVGRFGERWARALWAILGLSPALLFATAALMWWNRVLKPRFGFATGRAEARRYERRAVVSRQATFGATTDEGP